MNHRTIQKKRRRGLTRRQRKSAAERRLRRGLREWAAMDGFDRRVLQSMGFGPSDFGWPRNAGKWQKLRAEVYATGADAWAKLTQRTATEFAERHGLPVPTVTVETT
jgi:hypothetical protein